MALEPAPVLDRDRQRWLLVARSEATRAEWAGELHIAAAFTLVVATIEADRALDPPRHGRDVLKGRQAAHDRAIQLARAGLTSRAVARAVDEPYGTVYGWLRRDGVVQTRAQWRTAVAVPIRACETCGGSFRPRRPSARFCSNTCRGTAQVGHLPTR